MLDGGKKLGYNNGYEEKGGGPVNQREQTCCFTGHRPDKLPWGTDERDPRCLALKASILREVERLYLRGYRHFISGMARGCDLYFAEAVLELKERYPLVMLEGAVPCESQAARWREEEQLRRQRILEACDVETLVQQHYDRGCMHRRDRYMVDRSSAILSVFDGSPGGTLYTLNYAMTRRLDIFLLDLNRPGNAATELNYP